MSTSGQGGGAAGVAAECRDILHGQAAAYARLALANISKEFPSLLIRMMTSPGDFPNRPADRTPVFYGSLDWHSCVEMHWLLVRLLRLAGPAVPADEIRAALDAQFTAEKLAAEARFVASDDGRFERPYGWAWALAPASSRLAISCTSASAQAQPYGRSNRPSSLATKRASAAAFSAVNWASSAAMISSAGTAGPASRSSRTSSQCISTQECQSRLP